MFGFRATKLEDIRKWADAKKSGKICSALNNSDPLIVIAAAEAICRCCDLVDSPAVVFGTLCKLLGHQNRNVVVAAAEALYAVDIVGSRVGESLGALVAALIRLDEDTTAREAILEAIRLVISADSSKEERCLKVIRDIRAMAAEHPKAAYHLLYPVAKVYTWDISRYYDHEPGPEESRVGHALADLGVAAGQQLVRAAGTNPETKEAIGAKEFGTRLIDGRVCGSKHALDAACVCTKCGKSIHDFDSKCFCKRCGYRQHEWSQGVNSGGYHRCYRCGAQQHARGGDNRALIGCNG